MHSPTDASVFDPSNPTGNYELDMSDPYSMVVCRHLLHIVFNQKGIFASRVELNGKNFQMPDPESDESTWVFPKAGVLSFKY